MDENRQPMRACRRGATEDHVTTGALTPALWTDAGGELRDALSSKCGIDPASLEVEPIDLNASEIEAQLRHAAPAMLTTRGGRAGLHSIRGNTARLLAPDLSLKSVPLETLCQAVMREAASKHEADIDRMLDDCGIQGRKRETARRSLLRERIRDVRIGQAEQLRLTPGSDFVTQMRGAGLIRRFAVFAGAHGLEYSFWLLSWWMIGKGALDGRLDRGWLVAWALLLLTMVPLRMVMMWSQGVISIGLGGLLKQRLLSGMLRLPQDEIRHQGAGQLLGRVIESETVETLALTGGLGSLLALMELGLAGFVLATGAAGLPHLLLFVVFTGAVVAVTLGYARRRARWTTRRLDMTHDLVERMTGHRTRLAQEPPERRHTGEDEALEQYLRASQEMDRWNARVTALAPRGWVIVGLAGMAPAFVNATGSNTAELAVSLGGVLLAWRALQKLTAGMSQLAGAWIAWRTVEPLFRAAATGTEERGTEERGTAESRVEMKSRVVMESHEVTFRYGDRSEPVLRGVNLRIERGDWVLLEGGSGGGKSTLASVLVGLREPGSGLLMAGGLDRKTLGEHGWRRRVAAAPQYHENHVMAASFAFNLLMGRRWPARWEDLAEAEAVCRELGLGPLIERMPGGLQQMVGDTGWQLSQGERSRMFIARALLQGGDLVVLDESFAALDPETLRQSLECVLRRAKTLLVVAHP